MKHTMNLESGVFTYGSENVDGINVLSFLGIPYAKAERFGMPEKIATHRKTPVNSGVGMRFPQKNTPQLTNLFLKNPMRRREVLANKDKMDENAFALNIWTVDSEGKKPVLVFIHGGGFANGSGTTPLYNGKYLAAKGIVVVTINYRLGVLGFMPVMLDGKLSVNLGFYDQQCALKWIRQNISAFGGDAENITLMGQSAGGLSASMHMMNEESSKQFDKLILCSTSADRCVDLDHARKTADSFLKTNRLSGSEELRSLSWEKLIRLKMPLGFLASPVVDGVFLKDDVKNLTAASAFSPKPVMLGTNGDEFKMIDNKFWYKAMGIATEEADFRKKYLENCGPEEVSAVEELRKKYTTLAEVQFKLIEMLYHITALQKMEKYSMKAPCYGYRMNFVPNIWNGLRGAYHCAELPFIFGTIRDIGRSATEENLAQMEIIQNDWIAFMKEGSVPGREAFGENGKISLYEGRKARLVDFPQRKIVESLRDSALFPKIQTSFKKVIKFL